MEKDIVRFIDQNRFLSNFYPCNVRCLDDDYPSSEHAYQAMKSKDPEVRKQMKECKTPGEVRRLGKKIQIRPNWENMKYDIMLDIVSSKFEQHSDLKEKLLATGKIKLIEGNDWNDTYWGICRGAGENKLGEILMIVREYLKRKKLE